MSRLRWRAPGICRWSNRWPRPIRALRRASSCSASADQPLAARPRDHSTPAPADPVWRAALFAPVRRDRRARADNHRDPPLPAAPDAADFYPARRGRPRDHARSAGPAFRFCAGRRGKERAATARCRDDPAWTLRAQRLCKTRPDGASQTRRARLCSTTTARPSFMRRISIAGCRRGTGSGATLSTGSRRRIATIWSLPHISACSPKPAMPTAPR